MLAEDLIFQVNEDNDDGTTPMVPHAYRRFDKIDNRSFYITPTHSAEARDMLTFHRSLPKTNGNFRGVKKSTMKFTRDVIVLGADGISNITAQEIISVNFSSPVGMTEADMKIRRMTVIAAVADDDVMSAFTYVQEV